MDKCGVMYGRSKEVILTLLVQRGFPSSFLLLTEISGYDLPKQVSLPVTLFLRVAKKRTA